MLTVTFSYLPASNGNPRLPDSLHYIDPSGRPNAYQRVRNNSLFKFITTCLIDPSLTCYEFISRQLLRLGKCYSFMIQTNDFLLGDLGHDQLMVLFLIAST